MAEGTARIIPCMDGRGSLKVMGDVRDVLYSRITPAHIASKPFSQTEYSIGLGALGDKPEDYLPLLGEMMTIGGNMVWLPADGHDSPDYLLPKGGWPQGDDPNSLQCLYLRRVERPDSL